jgi:hypothetical protein
MGRYITTTGTAGSTFRAVSTTYNALVNDRILANSSGGAFNITLPATVTLLEGDTIQVIDASGTSGTNNINVLRNGSLVNGIAQDLTIDLANTVLTLVYSGATYGWIFTAA